MYYQFCAVCGTVVDDGGVHKGKFICHECYDSNV